MVLLILGPTGAGAESRAEGDASSLSYEDRVEPNDLDSFEEYLVEVEREQQFFEDQREFEALRGTPGPRPASARNSDF
jgi:hypothetical protein